MTDKLDSSKEPSKGAWTPGPWKFVIDADNMSGVSENEPVLGSICDEADEYHIARIWSDVVEAKANALLISKAPQMADLLLEIHENSAMPAETFEKLGRLLTDLYPNEEKAANENF
jgi:hypothetical protein